VNAALQHPLMTVYCLTGKDTAVIAATHIHQTLSAINLSSNSQNKTYYEVDN